MRTLAVLALFGLAVIVSFVRFQTGVDVPTTRPAAAAVPRPVPPPPPPPPADRPRDLQSVCLEGRAAAMQLFSPHLLAPASAKYPTDSLRSIELRPLQGIPPLFLVTGSVDSQNAFGAVLRSSWSVSLSYEAGGFRPFRCTLGADEFTIRPDFEARVDAAFLAGGGEGVAR